MELEDAIRRIQKCLALSKSSNAGEAAAAMRQAQKLMTAFNLEPEHVGMLVIEIHEAKSIACTKPPQWEVWLAAIIGKAFGCRAVHHRGWFDKARNRDGAKGKYIFIGPKAQSMTAAWTMDMLRNAIVKGRSDHVASRPGLHGLKERMASGNTWAEAFVTGVSAKVERFAQPEDTQAAIDRRVEELTGGSQFNKKNVTKRAKGDLYDANQGLKAGKEAQINRPISG